MAVTASVHFAITILLVLSQVRISEYDKISQILHEVIRAFSQPLVTLSLMYKAQKVMESLQHSGIRMPVMTPFVVLWAMNSLTVGAIVTLTWATIKTIIIKMKSTNSA